MRTANVVLRECDLASIQVITDYLQHHGLLVGRRTVSQAVRYALEHTADVIGEFNVITRESKRDASGASS